MQIKPGAKDLLTLVGFLFGLGVVWGTLSAQVNAQEEVVKTVPAAIVRIAVVETKIDYLIGLLEYKYGIRAVPPSRPRQLGQ